MAVKKVIKMGHPTLRLIAEEVPIDQITSNEIKELILDLKDTMKDYSGIGIAAPQINISKQVAIVGIPGDSDRYPDAPESREYIVINPKIEVLDDQKQGFWEGCLSVPGMRGFVERPRKVKVTFYNENADQVVLEVEDFLATVFQHELDHLFGLLYVDHIDKKEFFGYEDELTRSSE